MADLPVQDRVPEAAEEGLSPGEAGGEQQQRVPRRVEEEGFGIGPFGTNRARYLR